MKPEAGRATSFEYQLERTPVGVVLLDLGRRVRAVNGLARRLLGRPEAEAIGQDILALHPAAARPKVRWLIDAAENAADGTAGMVVTTAMGSLVAKVTLLRDGGVGDAGFCMMFHTLGDHVMAQAPAAPDRPHLLKLPVARGRATELIDIAEVVALTAQGHYALATILGASAPLLCPLSLADLERRVDPLVFVRMHRRHLVNLRHVLAAERQDGRWVLALGGGGRVPVGRDKVALVRRLLVV
ncbi:PAS domain-containing transcriptional regulator [Novispirillum sp. DQ9]|uniref:PAS domain-containing transcriptional regulator n=1 Tax=Novispirillum sp. DQ9 TaxID=3398612 RepID=UPI003C79D0F3